MTGLKNISKAEVLTLKDEVAYQKGQVVSKTLAQNAAPSICSARARASSCPPDIRTRCMGRSHSRCCSSWCSERRA